MRLSHIPLFLLLFIAACRGQTSTADIARYVGDSANGLIKKDSAGDVQLTCILLPEEREEGHDSTDVVRFKITMTTEREKVTDSMMYYMNYRSPEMFRLVKGTDTLMPALSERMANGRKDIHEFTVIFDDGGRVGKNNLWLLIDSGIMIPQQKTFAFTNKDITKAYKTLFAYEVKD
jgi:hypothetical protein